MYLKMYMFSLIYLLVKGFFLHLSFFQAPELMSIQLDCSLKANGSQQCMWNKVQSGLKS